MYENLYNQSTGQGFQNAYNDSANRLRERVQSAGAGIGNQMQNSNLSRGFGFSGINAAGQQQNDLNTLNAYGQGLAQLGQSFEGFRQQGLQTGYGAAQGLDKSVQFGQNLYANLVNNRDLLKNNYDVRRLTEASDLLGRNTSPNQVTPTR
jgi:hypothetical protein